MLTPPLPAAAAVFSCCQGQRCSGTRRVQATWPTCARIRACTTLVAIDFTLRALAPSYQDVTWPLAYTARETCPESNLYTVIGPPLGKRTAGQSLCCVPETVEHNSTSWLALNTTGSTLASLMCITLPVLDRRCTASSRGPPTFKIGTVSKKAVIWCRLVPRVRLSRTSVTGRCL